MKGFLAALVSLVVLSGCDVIKQLPTNSYPASGVSQAEAAQGIKEALSQGLVKAVVQLNRENGFFGDALYKILLPPDAKKIENALRTVGLG